MNKLLGFYCYRSAKPAKENKAVWCGFTEQAREDHKRFILDVVACPDWDGVTSFENVETDVIIEPDQWWLTANGNYVNIQRVKGFEFIGYCFKTKQLPKTIPDNVKTVLGYVNGECLNGWELVEKV